MTKICTTNGAVRALNRCRRGAMIALAACLVMLPATRTLAQGTQGAVPDPISTRQLMTYADRMNLSPQQRQAFEAIHDDYKREFRALREGEIADFLKTASAMQGGMPKRDDVVEIFELMSRLHGRIRLIDDKLFNRIAPLLTEEQIVMLPRVKLARERSRFESRQMMWMGGRPPANMSEIAMAMNLPVETFAAIDPILASNEQRVTSEMDRLAKASDRMSMSLFDVLEQAGFGEMTQEEIMSDSKRLQEMMTTMQNAWADLSRKINEHAADIREMNEVTFTTITSQLPAEHHRDFRLRYYRDAYPELAGLLTQGRTDYVDRILASDDLDDNSREAIGQIITEYRMAADRLVDEGAKLVREQRKSFSPFEFGSEAYQEYQAELGKLNAKGAELANVAITKVNEMISPEMAADLQKAMAAQFTEDHPETVAVAAEAEPQAVSMTGDPLVPARITVRDVAEYARLLSLDDGQRSVVEELHREYVESMGSLPELTLLREARQSMWSYNADTGSYEPPSDSKLDDISRARRTAFDAVARTDDTFFDDVQLTIFGTEPNESMDRVRRSRRFQRLQVTSEHYNFYGMNRSAESDVDLTDIVRTLSLGGESQAALDLVIAEYEQDTLPTMLQRYEAHIAQQDTSDRANTFAQRAQSDGTQSMEWALKYQEMIAGAAKAAGDANTALVERNRAALDRLAAALPDDKASALRRAYNVEAYPTVYQDPMSVTEHIVRAQQLDDLSSDQRQNLGELAATYLSEYDRLSKEMVAFTGSDRPITGFNSEDWKESQRRQSEFATVKFDRDELNLRAISQLRNQLTEEQLALIGGLPQTEVVEERVLFGG